MAVGRSFVVDRSTKRSAEKWLRFLLRFNGILAVGGIFAVVMPHTWLVWCVGKVEPDMPVGLLVSYLARALSAFYVLLGLLLILFATHVRRYRRPITVMMLWTLFAAGSLLVQAVTFIRDTSDSWFLWALLADAVYGIVTAVACLVLQWRIANAMNDSDYHMV